MRLRRQIFYGSETDTGQPYITFNNSSTVINCLSGATLDDLCAGGNIMTIETFLKHDGDVTDGIMCKSNGSNNGWRFFIATAYKVQFKLYLVTNNVAGTSSGAINDGAWHHLVGYYNDTTKEGRVAVDGTWGPAEGGAGDYKSDAAQNLFVGAKNGVADFLGGSIGWFRVSDNDRYDGATPTNFTAPERTAVPDVDGNTVGLWAVDEGAGTTVADSSGNSNNGTLSNGTWGT